MPVVLVGHDPDRRAEVAGDQLLGQHLGGRPARLLAAAVQEQEPVGVLARVREVVHGAHDGEAAVRAQRGHQLEHLLLRADVERARRLVQEEQGGVLRDRAREHGALALAAAQRAEPPVEQVRPVEAGERRARGHDVPEPRAARVAEVRRPAEDDVLEHGRVRRDDRDLRDDRDPPGDRAPAEPGDLVPLEPDRARVRDEAGDRPQERRLAGAVRADQAQPLPVLDREVDVVDDPRAVERDRDRLRPEHHGPTVLVVRRTNAKKGAPRNAVTTPIGSCPGAITVRATRSMSTRKPAPNASESGRTTR